MRIDIQFNTPFVSCDWYNWHTLVKKAGAFTSKSNWYLSVLYCKGVLFEFKIECQPPFFNDPRGIIFRFSLLGLVIDIKTGIWSSTSDPESWSRPFKESK